MAAFLASCCSLLLGLALGAAFQHWGNGDRATEHHTRYDLHRQIADQWSGL